jgi:hypothetical protein
MHVAAVDGDPPRLRPLRDFADQFDLEQTVVEGRVLDLDVVGQVELTGRDIPIKELALGSSVLPPSMVATFCSAVTEISSGEKAAP